MIAGWIASGGIAGCILGLTVLEVAALALYRRITGTGLAPADYLPNILAGDFLLLAWWCAVAHWVWAAAALLGALLAHTADMAGRMRGRVLPSSRKGTI